ncbi:tetrapyrrole biosynthesis uroporphyrinogen III synthase [Penicillium chermesinum]|nr:tetrapyrrole biosynthesis uroporphyrinogen III synthase [Penicillium chermesinum]
MTVATLRTMSARSPILLLKTKSSPHDGYDEFFSANHYNPVFIPVLEHRFHRENLARVRGSLRIRRIQPRGKRE